MDAEQTPAINCPNCGCADVTPSQVRSAFWQGERLVVVEDVPALVCTRCGERLYDDSTAIGLDLLRGDGFPPEQARYEMRVLVFSFSERMAAKET
jgi:YgiT-type zinc finger domain-containing protein